MNITQRDVNALNALMPNEDGPRFDLYGIEHMACSSRDALCMEVLRAWERDGVSFTCHGAARPKEWQVALSRDWSFVSKASDLLEALLKCNTEYQEKKK